MQVSRDAKEIVIHCVTFKFESKGSLQINGKLPAIREYRKITGCDLAEAMTEIEMAISELLGVAAMEQVARLAFKAGERTETRERARELLKPVI